MGEEEEEERAREGKLISVSRSSNGTHGECGRRSFRIYLLHCFCPLPLSHRESFVAILGITSSLHFLILLSHSRFHLSITLSFSGCLSLHLLPWFPFISLSLPQIM